MTALRSSISPARQAALARMGTAAMFFANGLALATWTLHIPDTRDRLHLTAGTVGAALLAVAVGGLITMPLSGGWTARFGSAAVTRVSAVLLCGALLLPFLAPNLAGLIAGLLIVGLCNGAMDVAMNAQGVAVERRLGRPVMSGFHAFYSVGNVVGALAGSALLGLGLPALPHALGVAALALLLVLLGGRALLPAQADLPGEPQAQGEAQSQEEGRQDAEQRDRDTPAFPRAALLLPLLGLLCFLGMLSEGSSTDWSGLFLADVLGARGAAVGYAYSAVVIAMTLGRVFGDRWRTLYSDSRVVTLGALASAVGVGLALFSPVGWLPLAVLGFFITGLGLANIVPVLYSTAGRALAGPGIARVATLGYAGFLVGPPVIGFVAQHTSLRAGLGVVSVSLLLVGALVPLVYRRLEQPGGPETAGGDTPADLGPLYSPSDDPARS